MTQTVESPTAYEVGRQSIRLFDEQSAAEGLDVANAFQQKFSCDADAMAEFARGIEDEKRARNLD